MANSDSDSDCWYDKDDAEILESVRVQANAKADINTEYISASSDISAAADEFIKEHDVKASEKTQSQRKGKIPLVELKKIQEMTHIDAFLYLITQENLFAEGVLAANESNDKVFIYLSIMKRLTDLELPGFQNDLLQNFLEDQVLFDHICYITTKLFSQRYKIMWKEAQKIANFISDIQSLFIKSHKWAVLTENARKAMVHICKIFKESKFAEVVANPKCIELVGHLTAILEESDAKLQKSASHDIYPGMEDLLGSDDFSIDLMLKKLIEEDEEEIASEDASNSPESLKFSNIEAYVEYQKNHLREDFLASCRSMMGVLKKEKSFDAVSNIAKNVFMAEGVHLVLNDQFVDANRHEMLFVDVMAGREREESNAKLPADMKAMLKNVKTGALLCFTTNWEFDCLIMAKVVYTSPEIHRHGYIGVEIMRQHNIGNIYNKPLICFETPIFFEPFDNVFGYLANCNLDEFPLKDFFTEQEKCHDRKPAYLTKDKSIEKKIKDTITKPKHLSSPLNTYQQEALSEALVHAFYLIQGPPGTGKTHLSVELVRTLIESVPSQPIVLVTYTNDSLDKFLLNLSKYTESIVRFGSRSQHADLAKFNVRSLADSTMVNPRLKRLYYLVNLEFKAKFDRLQELPRDFDGTDDSYGLILHAQREVRGVCEKLNSIRLMFQYYVVREKNIIALTTTCAAKTNFLFRLLQSSVVIFEEAGEILESHVLACLTPFTEHIIMIGDHKQLRPYGAITPFSTRSATTEVSLFERLLTHNSVKHTVLKMQYRMRPCIAALLCGTFYEELHNAESVESYPMVTGMAKDLFFVSHAAEETMSKDGSYCNDYEVDCLIKLATRLLTVGGYQPSDVVILSPYACQVGCFQQQIAKSSCPKVREIRASTVDTFQGCEATIVLISLVRSAQVGFLKEPNRICVLLSRAKHGMYIMGNMKLLQRSRPWRAIKQKLESQEAIETCDDPENKFPFPYSTA